MGFGRGSTEARDRRRPRLAGPALAAVAFAAGSLAFAAPALAATTRSSSVDVNGIASSLDPAIVDVNTTLAQGAAAGTGMVITSSGEVLTNNHVIDGATSVSVTVSGGKSYSARVLGYDATDDVALLQVNGAPKLPTITASSTKPSVGDSVLALGNALGKGGTPATAPGQVTAVNQTITATDDNGANPETLNDLIQINANIQPGDSGGPLVNANGQVVGMDSAGSSSQAATTSPGSAYGPGSGSGYGPGSGFGGGAGLDPSSGIGGGFGGGSSGGSSSGGGSYGGGSGLGGGNSSGGSGSGSSSGTTGYAIPIQNTLTIAHQIESGKSSGNVTVGARAILGVEVQDTSGQGSAGGQGGLGGGSSIGGGSNFGGGSGIGGGANIGGGSDVGGGSDTGGGSNFGGQSTSGVQISGVESGTPAASAGLAAGDTITSIDGNNVASSTDITSALNGHHVGDHVNVTWVDGSGNQQQASIALVAGPPA